MKPSRFQAGCVGFLALVLVTFFSGPSTAFALPTLNVQNGILMGANGVSVGSTLYNVQFLDGTCAALYTGCDAVADFTFQDLTSVQAASQALLDQVLLNQVPLGNFDTEPHLTNGCTDNTLCNIATPYGLFPATQFTLQYIAQNTTHPLNDFIFSDFGNVTFDSSPVSIFTYAVWSPAPTSVPEPSTAVLLISGLLGLGGYEWRRRVASTQIR